MVRFNMLAHGKEGEKDGFLFTSLAPQNNPLTYNKTHYFHADA